eukprot:3894663-Alexandrium_andersonii.AAC.1
MGRALARHGLEFAVADWFVVCPFHHGSEGRPYESAKTARCGDVDARLAHSLCAVNAAQSSKRTLKA